MGWKTIVINEQTRISLFLNNLKISYDDEYITIPISDIETIIFEHNATIITIPILVKLLQNNINIVVCDETHDPMGIFLPFNNHCNAFKKLNIQLNWQEGRKNKLWTMIITEKIQGEIINLQLAKLENYKLIQKHCNYVKLGDKTNREAVSARIYFNSYFDNFTRFHHDTINSALNYGYKIIASYISRFIASRGYLTQLGIHHKGESNPFNLTYDFIEPFRIIVDRYVYTYLSMEEEFNMVHRYNLVNLLNCKVKVGNEKCILTKAIDKIIDSYFAVLNREREDILTYDYQYIEYETN